MRLLCRMLNAADGGVNETRHGCLPYKLNHSPPHHKVSSEKQEPPHPHICLLSSLQTLRISSHDEILPQKNSDLCVAFQRIDHVLLMKSSVLKSKVCLGQRFFFLSTKCLVGAQQCVPKTQEFTKA